MDGRRWAKQRFLEQTELAKNRALAEYLGEASTIKVGSRRIQRDARGETTNDVEERKVQSIARWCRSVSVTASFQVSGVVSDLGPGARPMVKSTILL